MAPAVGGSGLASTFDGDDFVNNLFTDLSPLLALFGEQVTKQFISLSMGWADCILLSVFPLGILTIIVSAIRVGGEAHLKALIGRAREPNAEAESEILSSISKDVCELWDGRSIIRVQGKSTAKPIFYNHHDNTRYEHDHAWKASPNLHLNIPGAIPSKAETRVFAGIAVGLQLAVLVLAAYGRYRWRWSVPYGVTNYGYPCFCAGTITLIVGLIICVRIVDSRTTESVLDIHKHCGLRDREQLLPDGRSESSQESPRSDPTHPQENRPQSDPPHTPEDCPNQFLMLQGAGVVGDKHVPACFIPIAQSGLVKMSRPYEHMHPHLPRSFLSARPWTTLQILKALLRLISQILGTHNFPKTWTVLGTSIAMLGFVIQFVGIRALPWWVGIMQLGGTAFLAGFRAWLRQGLSQKPQVLYMSDFDHLRDDKMAVETISHLVASDFFAIPFVGMPFTLYRDNDVWTWDPRRKDQLVPERKAHRPESMSFGHRIANMSKLSKQLAERIPEIYGLQPDHDESVTAFFLQVQQLFEKTLIIFFDWSLKRAPNGTFPTSHEFIYSPGQRPNDKREPAKTSLKFGYSPEVWEMDAGSIACMRSILILWFGKLNGALRMEPSKHYYYRIVGDGRTLDYDELSNLLERPPSGTIDNCLSGEAFAEDILLGYPLLEHYRNLSDNPVGLTVNDYLVVQLRKGHYTSDPGDSDDTEVARAHTLVLCAQELFIAFLLDLLSNSVSEADDARGSTMSSLAADITHIVSESCLVDGQLTASPPADHGIPESALGARLLVLPVFIALGILPTNDAVNIGEEIPPTSQITPPSDVSAQDPTTDADPETRPTT